MSDVTGILLKLEAGDGKAAEQLIPIVYDELRRLAKSRMASERPDHTLQPTALVHEAFVRLVDVEQSRHWSSRQHFFASAAEAMRRILVESARSRGRLKRGGGTPRQTGADQELPVLNFSEQLLAIDEVLDRLEEQDPTAGKLTKLKYFAGMSTDEAADILEISRATAFRKWSVARAWLQCELAE